MEVTEILTNLIKVHKTSKEEVHEWLLIRTMWNEEKEAHLSFAKEEINIQNWNVLNELEGDVVVQILYDWLNDCVQFVITKDKLLKLKELDVFSHVMSEGTDTSLAAIKQVKNVLRSELRSLEFNSILRLSTFFCEIYPESDEELGTFDKVLTIICSLLLGYGEEKDNDESINILKMTIRVFAQSMFQEIANSNVHSQESNSNFMKFTIKESKKSLGKKLKANMYKEKLTSYVEDYLSNKKEGDVEGLENYLIEKITLDQSLKVSNILNEGELAEVYSDLKPLKRDRKLEKSVSFIEKEKEKKKLKISFENKDLSVALKSSLGKLRSKQFVEDSQDRIVKTERN